MTYSHYSVTLRGNKNLAPAERREDTRARRNILKAAGFKAERYFQFRDGDANGQRDAAALAGAYADEVLAKTGVTLEIHEGCFA